MLDGVIVTLLIILAVGLYGHVVVERLRRR